jgi:methylmalonyl-CoA mutase N-terminal domain/subunit
VVRVTIQALASVLGGTQSLHTNSFDEALTLPSEESARLALRTQQILAHESGVTRTVDPLAGSHYVEDLTDRIEAKAREYLETIDGLGGAAQALDLMKEEIHRSAYAHQLAVESGERQVVGMNVFQEKEGALHREQPDYRSLERAQCAKLQDLKEGRDADRVRTALRTIREAAQGSDNLLPPIIDAVKAMATLGEISGALREEWGSHDTV